MVAVQQDLRLDKIFGLGSQERGRAAAQVEAAEAHARAAQLEAQGLQGALQAAEERAREEAPGAARPWPSLSTRR